MNLDNYCITWAHYNSPAQKWPKHGAFSRIFLYLRNTEYYAQVRMTNSLTKVSIWGCRDNVWSNIIIFLTWGLISTVWSFQQTSLCCAWTWTRLIQSYLHLALVCSIHNLISDTQSFTSKNLSTKQYLASLLQCRFVCD